MLSKLESPEHCWHKWKWYWPALMKQKSCTAISSTCRGWVRKGCGAWMAPLPGHLTLWDECPLNCSEHSVFTFKRLSRSVCHGFLSENSFLEPGWRYIIQTLYLLRVERLCQWIHKTADGKVLPPWGKVEWMKGFLQELGDDDSSLDHSSDPMVRYFSSSHFQIIITIMLW